MSTMLEIKKGSVPRLTIPSLSQTHIALVKNLFSQPKSPFTDPTLVLPPNQHTSLALQAIYGAQHPFHGFYYEAFRWEEEGCRDSKGYYL